MRLQVVLCAAFLLVLLPLPTGGASGCSNPGPTGPPIGTTVVLPTNGANWDGVAAGGTPVPLYVQPANADGPAGLCLPTAGLGDSTQAFLANPSIAPASCPQTDADAGVLLPVAIPWLVSPGWPGPSVSYPTGIEFDSDGQLHAEGGSYELHKENSWLTLPGPTEGMCVPFVMWDDEGAFDQCLTCLP